MKLYQIDAFADRVFQGNPAAVVPLDAWLPDAQMQAIAAENNLSETAFFVPQNPNGYEPALVYAHAGSAFVRTRDFGVWVCGSDRADASPKAAVTFHHPKRPADGSPRRAAPANGLSAPRADSG